MSKMHTDFVNKYKELDALYKNQGLDIKEVEESSSITFQSHLRFCRLMRNYISHNDDYGSFVAITPAMMKFLTDTIKELDKDTSKAKHLMSKKPIAVDTTLFSDIAKLIAHFNTVVIVDKAGIYKGIFTKKGLCKMISEGKVGKTSKITDFIEKAKPVIVDPEEEGKNIDDELTIVEKTGRVIGVINAE